jgi:CxxC motif-containing protein
MQTTYRLKAQEMSITFLKSLKTLFAGQEIEITIKSVEPVQKDREKLMEMMKENRLNAPIISPDIDIRSLIDESQYPSE